MHFWHFTYCIKTISTLKGLVVSELIVPHSRAYFRAKMGLLEPGDIFVYSLCWHTPQSWCAHLSCQVGQPGLMDTGTNCCMLKIFFSHFLILVIVLSVLMCSKMVQNRWLFTPWTYFDFVSCVIYGLPKQTWVG